MKELPRPLVQQAHPQLCFVQMHDSDPGVIVNARLIDPGLVVYLFNQGGAGKRALATAIAATLGERDESPFPMRESVMAGGVRPDIAVQVSEAWMAVEVPKNDPVWKLQPSQRLDRSDALAVFVHVKGHTTGQVMQITTSDGRRHVDYLPLPTVAQGGIIGGDMAMQKWDDAPEEHRP